MIFKIINYVVHKYLFNMVPVTARYCISKVKSRDRPFKPGADGAKLRSIEVTMELYLGYN